MQIKGAAATLALVLLLGGCSSNGGPKEAPGAAITVANIAYSPASLEISVGDTVTWTSEDEGVRHTVTSGLPAGDTVPGVSEGEAAKPDGTFNGSLTDAGDTFAFTFDTAGTYAYFCEVHPSMTAEIIVR
jgi:plastocyanin